MRALVPSLLLLALLAGCGAPAGLAPLALSAAEGLDASDLATLDALASKNKKKQPAGSRSLDMENFKQVNAGLYRGGVPSDDQLGELKKLGVKTDITLMNASVAREREVIEHEKKTAEGLGMRVINLSLPFNRQPPKAMVDEFLATVTDKAAQPVYVHCIHGRDRTGTMVAVFRMTVDHLSNADALAEMETFGFNPKKYPLWAKFVQTFKPEAS